MRWLRQENGYTLIEVLIVLMIVAIFIGMASPRYGHSNERIRSGIDQANILQIEQGARLFRIDLGRYPQSVDDLFVNKNEEAGWRGPYLEEKPVPSSDAITYQIDGKGNVAAVRS